jgi:5-methylcytosine-specific restriction enzyme subunit McrC
MKVVRFQEHETALVGDNAIHCSLTVREVEDLDRAQHAIGVEVFSWVSRNRIKMTQYVGMLATPMVRLEILPKIDNLKTSETRNTLIRMICVAWDIPLAEGDLTGHDYQTFDILELLIAAFARRLRNEIRAGLSRAYTGNEQDLFRMRGKMLVKRQFTTLAANPQRLACQYDEFTANIGLNQILLCAVLFLARRTSRPETQRLLNEIAMHLPDVCAISVPEAMNEKVFFDRANRRWEVVVTLARQLLAGIYQTPYSGEQIGLAVLFDMNLLFERYVAELAKKPCRSLGYAVRTQRPVRCLARTHDGKPVFSTHPDIHLEKEQDVIILDTKWKKLDPARPNLDVPQSDGYQMHGYAHVYGASATVLVFPHQMVLPGNSGKQIEFRYERGGSALIIATIDLANPNEFVMFLRSLLSPISR